MGGERLDAAEVGGQRPAGGCPGGGGGGDWAADRRKHLLRRTTSSSTYRWNMQSKHGSTSVPPRVATPDSSFPCPL